MESFTNLLWHDLCVLPSLLPYELFYEMAQVMRDLAILVVAQEAWEVSFKLCLVTLILLTSVWRNNKV
jgi:hypothetical protein